MNAFMCLSLLAVVLVFEVTRKIFILPETSYFSIKLLLHVENCSYSPGS